MNKLSMIVLSVFVLALSACSTNETNKSDVQNLDKLISDAYYDDALETIQTQSVEYNYTPDQIQLLQKVERCIADAFPSIIDESIKQQFVDDIKISGFDAAINNYGVNNNALTQIDYRCKVKVAPQLTPNYASN